MAVHATPSVAFCPAVGSGWRQENLLSSTDRPGPTDHALLAAGTAAYDWRGFEALDKVPEALRVGERASPLCLVHDFTKRLRGNAANEAASQMTSRLRPCLRHESTRLAVTLTHIRFGSRYRRMAHLYLR
jgi:hypothetical protein